MIEALESDYAEMARLKGVPGWRIVLMHALPNATAPTVQVIGLNFLYLAGGVVIVEYDARISVWAWPTSLGEQGNRSLPHHRAAARTVAS